MLESMLMTCNPRPEIQAGKLAEEMFAAKIQPVVGRKAPAVYQDLSRFFANTFPTDGVKTLTKVAWYLDDDPMESRSSFKEELSINKIIAEEKEQVGKGEAKDELRSRRDSIFATQVFKLVAAPQSPGDGDFSFESLDNLSAQASSTQIKKNPSLRITKRKYLPHWQMDGAIYFLTFVTQDRLELNDAARETVLKACQFFNSKRYQTFALVIMPDHVHWLLKPLPTNDGAYWTLTSITHSIKSFTAKEVPNVMKHIGKLWQIESYDRIIRDEKEFLDTWEYIRQNPVKDGLSKSPEDYPFFWEETENAPSLNLESSSAQASSVRKRNGK